MSWSITFDIYGTHFRPETLDQKIKDKLSKIEIGFAQYKSSNSQNPESAIIEIHNVFYPLISELKNAGAEEWHVNIGRFYKNQCNEEFSLETMKKLVDLKCGFIYSAYEDD